MPDTGRVGDLDVAQDLPFQRRGWAIQRVGWVVLAALFAGSAAGLFGSGPLSHTSAGARDGPLWAEYPRFWHAGSPMVLRLHVGPEAVSDGEVRVWIRRAYLETLRVQQVSPAPERVEAGRDRLTYTFAVSGAPTAFTFTLEADQAGAVPGRVGLEQGPTVDLHHVIYP